MSTTVITPVTVTTTPTLVLAANAARSVAVLIDDAGSAVTIGPAGLAYGQGVILGPKDGWQDTDTVDAWYAVTESGTATVTGYEETAA